MTKNTSLKLIGQQRSRRGLEIADGPRLLADGETITSSDVQTIQVELGQVLIRVAATAPEGVKSVYGVGDRLPDKKSGFPNLGEAPEGQSPSRGER